MNDSLQPSTRVIYAAFDFYRRNRGRILLGILGIGLLVFLGSGFYVVKKEELGVRTRFGRVVDDNVQPGWHYIVPLIEKTQVRKVLRIDAYQVASREGGTANFTILSGDTNLLEVTIAIQYRIDNLRNYLFASSDPVQILTMLAREELVSIIGQNFIDLILTLNRNLIQGHLEQSIAEELERNDIGLELVALNLVDVSPIEETRAAFRDVSDAIADKAQTISNANRQSERFLARSRGQAEAMLMDARAKAMARVTQAGSSAKAFLELLAEYRKSPTQVTITRYWQRMRTIFRDASLSAVNPGASSTIDINMIDGLAGTTPPEIFQPPEERPLLAATTSGARDETHSLETVASDKFLISGQFHSRSAERDDISAARLQSLIFDMPSVFSHRGVKSSAAPAARQANTAPMVETIPEEEAAAGEQEGNADE